MKQNQDSQTVSTAEAKGFTLLEVLFAITILTVGLLGIASMQASSIRGNAFAGSVTEGTVWAEDQIEKLMETPYNDPLLQDADNDGTAGLNDTGFDNNPTTQGDADHCKVESRYSLYWNVADDAVLTNTKTINAIVIWTDHGVQKRVSLSYIKADLI